MAKMKRITGKKEKARVALQPTAAERFGVFMGDWGRLVVPVGIGVILTALRLTGVLDDTGLGFTLGLVCLLGVLGAFVAIVWRNLFPAWVRPATMVMVLVVLAGLVVPYVETVYPGEPDFTANLRVNSEPAAIGAPVTGYHRVEVYASSLANRTGSRGTEGRYKVSVAGTELSGQFTDRQQATRSGRRGTRRVEQKHIMELHPVDIPAGEKVVKVQRLDADAGPELRVTLYPALIPPPVARLLLALAFLFAVALDTVFQEQTIRWRLAPWIGMTAAFAMIFDSSFDRGSVTNMVIWSLIFGGAVGFTTGWLVSLVTRQLCCRIRTRI